MMTRRIFSPFLIGITLTAIAIAVSHVRAEWPCCTTNGPASVSELARLESQVDDLRRRVEKLESSNR